MSARAYAEISPYSKTRGVDRSPLYLFPSYEQQQKMEARRHQRMQRQQAEQTSHQFQKEDDAMWEAETQRGFSQQTTTRRRPHDHYDRRNPEAHHDGMQFNQDYQSTQTLRSNHWQTTDKQKTEDAGAVDNIAFKRIYGYKESQHKEKKLSPREQRVKVKSVVDRLYTHPGTTCTTVHSDKPMVSPDGSEEGENANEEHRLIKQELEELKREMANLKKSKGKIPTKSPALAEKDEDSTVQSLQTAVSTLQEELQELREVQFRSLMQEQVSQQVSKQREDELVALEKAKFVEAQKHLEAARVQVVKRLSGTLGHPSLFVFHYDGVVPISRPQIDTLIEEAGGVDQCLLILTDLEKAGLQFESMEELNKAVHELPRSHFVEQPKFAVHKSPRQEGKYEIQQGLNGRATWQQSTQPQGSAGVATRLRPENDPNHIDLDQFVEHHLHPDH